MAAEGTSETALSIISNDYADCRVLSVSGRVDHTNSGAFLEDLSAHASTVTAGLVVDLSHLDFITSAGLRALMIAQRTVTGQGGKMVVSGLQGSVREVFRISKFDALLTVTETTAEGVAGISDAARAAYPD